MSDMLVKLYTLPDASLLLKNLKNKNIEIRQAKPAEKKSIVDWVHQRFSAAVAAECEAAIEQRPITCYIAIEKQKDIQQPITSYDDLPAERLLGFACYDVTSKGMFGPEGVCIERRRQGIGTALLLTCLNAMKMDRYAYAVIGWAGSQEFYAKAVGATVIDGSEPSVYTGPLLTNQ